MRKTLFTTIFILITVVSSVAQTYWQMSTDTVTKSGYYHIALSQELAGLGLNTLRIVGSGEKEIPYFIRTSSPVREIKQLRMYELVAHIKKDSINMIVVKSDGEPLSRFYLQMKPADVRKYVIVQGSYDRKEWFSVKQRSLLFSEQNELFGEISIVDFPQSDYMYYQLTVTNNSSSPLDITGVGKMEQNSLYGDFEVLNVGGFTVEEKDNQTIISFPQMKYPFYLSKLEMTVDGKGHYNRCLQMIENDRIITKDQLSSQTGNSFYFDQLLINKKTTFVIENGENLPLNIRDVKLFGIQRYLCAYLDGGINYKVKTTSEPRPRYEIDSFAGKIPLDIPVINAGGLEEKQMEPLPERTVRFYESPLFLWSVIVFAGGLLLWLCLNLLRDIKKRKE